MFEAYSHEDLPNEEQKNLLREIDEKVYCIETICNKGKSAYNSLINEIKYYLSQGFEIRQYRTYPVKMKFKETDEKVYVLQLRHFLTNLLFWKPFVLIDEHMALGEKHFIEPERLSTGYIAQYNNTHIIIPYRKVIKNKKINKILDDQRFELSQIARDYNVIMGLSIDLETFMDVAQKNKRFDEIIHTHLDPNLQPKENEHILNSLQNELVHILKEEAPGNHLQPLLKAGAGIKERQLGEFSIAGGYKPDLSGLTQPLPITSNFILGGLGNIPNYYIDSTGGRKAAVMNNDVMGKAGWFARKMMLVSTDVVLRRDKKVCRSVNGIKYLVRNKEFLNRLVGRYYIEKTGDQFKVITKDDTQLIGKTIMVKSPVTCSSSKGICRKCYGDLFYTNDELYSAGALSGTKTTNPISQNVLSTKHLLTTDSEEIVFNDNFYKFFNLYGADINIIEESDIDINNYSVLLYDDEIAAIDEFDESDYNSYVKKFYVYNHLDQEKYEINEKGGKYIYISPAFMKMIKEQKKKRGSNSNEIMIKFSTIEDKLAQYSPTHTYDDGEDEFTDSPKLFSIIIANNEMTRPLYEIQHTLDRKDQGGCQTIDEFCQRLMDLFIESKIDLDAVHAEMLVRPLVRSSKDILRVPNWNVFQYNEHIPEGTPEKDYDKFHRDYQILTVSGALMNNPSVLVGLSFERLASQITDPTTYRKSAPSFLDPFFRERLE